MSLIDDIKSVDELPAEGSYDIVVITDPNFCRTEVRKNAEIFLFLRYGHEIEWFFFENAPEKCKKNVLYRDDGRKVNSFIDMLSKEYIIPEGITPVPIWQPNERQNKMDIYRVVMTNFKMEKYVGPDLYVAMKIAENIGYETTLYKNDVPIKWHSVISGWNKF